MFRYVLFGLGSFLTPQTLQFGALACTPCDSEFSPCRKQSQNNFQISLNIVPKSSQNQQKNHQTINQKLYQIFDQFLHPKWTQNDPLDTSAGLRGSCEKASSIPAGITVSPADPPGRRHIIKEYCTITNKDGTACGIWRPANS